VSPGEYLRARSGDYELLAAWHAERAPMDDEHVVACQAMLADERSAAARDHERVGARRN
jgi:hypothetical protein